ncbi:hypothetical protein F503_08453 [Ophiostoma piceae UAMH 11346]|uniref:Uncharacterized protein n=1 Tax=Ophiostoma piceae (strain UAMH 11346) TaxID=1262450 RepID=S3BZG9_OPHP1|nr:hypothetical protein F503_08453 [Ophiostoma piceae UAMH 11346]
MLLINASSVLVSSYAPTKFYLPITTMKLSINALALGAVLFSGFIPGSLAGPITTSAKYVDDELHGPFNDTLVSINLLIPHIKAAHEAAGYSVAALRDMYFKYRLSPGSMAKVHDIDMLWLASTQFYRDVIESTEELLPLLTELEELMFNNAEATELYHNMYKA